jgi:multidrug resistance efflux pump
MKQDHWSISRKTLRTSFFVMIKSQSPSSFDARVTCARLTLSAMVQGIMATVPVDPDAVFDGSFAA